MEYQAEALGHTRVVVIAIDESSHSDDAVNCELLVSVVSSIMFLLCLLFCIHSHSILPSCRLRSSLGCKGRHFT